MERQIVFKALIGPKNYNLDIKLKLDEDYRSFVMPSFDDLYDGITDVTVSKKCYDIRKLPDFFEHANHPFAVCEMRIVVRGSRQMKKTRQIIRRVFDFAYSAAWITSLPS
jgi:hypothetical protein